MTLNQDGFNLSSIACFATATKETAATASNGLISPQGMNGSRYLAVIQPFVVAGAHFAAIAAVRQTNSGMYFDHPQYTNCNGSCRILNGWYIHYGNCIVTGNLLSKAQLQSHIFHYNL